MNMFKGKLKVEVKYQTLIWDIEFWNSYVRQADDDEELEKTYIEERDKAIKIKDQFLEDHAEEFL
ncbi:MAG: hypothetical protein KAI79_09195 [Bacteroidales bacterium]|nr:hypothetical protein [Bacteroidales bacterium]